MNEKNRFINNKNYFLFIYKILGVVMIYKYKNDIFIVFILLLQILNSLIIVKNLLLWVLYYISIRIIFKKKNHQMQLASIIQNKLIKNFTNYIF